MANKPRTAIGSLINGNYYITNARFKNLAVLRNDDDGTELIAGIIDQAPGEIWEIASLNNNTFSIMNQSFGLYANCRMRPTKGEVVEAKGLRKQWYIKESRYRGKYMISPLEGYLCWSLDDGVLNTPITLADESNSDKNMWIFTFA
ncbi:hypothetical protein BD410DRAFT_385769 [Rickenella mellea]|uniref:Ricin B lectin domain-containing protein n=1 Tax=Rickenella mellea TaxID=50990 RepID=A0A4Y7PXR1_9AGAM|nr:hypothetical protein BD410DRAFT_385769 [Rickenella mellea]